MTTRTFALADLALREAVLDDAAFVADMYTELFPEEPEDPVLWRHSWEHPWERGKVERFIAERDGRPAGFLTMSHVPWDQMPERYARLGGDISRRLRTSERLEALVALTEERARADGAFRGTFWAWEYDKPKLDVLSSRGFKEERRERFWELDLVARREDLERMTAESRKRMLDQGIKIGTAADDPDPELKRKIHVMSEEASQDTPRSVPWTPTPYDTFVQWFTNPGVHMDRAWIARRGDEVVGVSMLNYPPVRGVVVTDWTGTARSVRGMGVARALKCETVMQAIALGVDRVRTDNDSQNKPILHINESMGYRPRPEMIQFIKELAAS